MEFVFEVSVCFLGFAIFAGVLSIGCAVADHVFPRIPFIQRYLDRLEDFEDDEEVYREYLESRERIRHRRRNRKAGRRLVR